MTKKKSFTITIDNQHVVARPGLTIMEAARKNAVYIPSLCALEGLPSFGACRMCIVEVDGLRGFPTACTTPVEEGMVIRTDSAEIRTLRQEILRLVLSEHPASCLFCGEKEECGQFQGTIRKAGMTTGCRYCPNDGRCELQQITERVGLADTAYPIRYRGLPVEKDDPFYDRDYNLCVLCGRCVRICNTVRMNGTLSFKQRGKLTTIGPAFDRSHMDAGCEFCGACVSVCPTGTLSAKTSKWYGKPEGETPSVCPYCAVGCRLLLQTSRGRVVDVLPDYTSPVDEGLLCVKGRFAVPEVLNSPARVLEPRLLTPFGYEVVSWERALSEARERLAEAPPDGFLMVLSPQLSNEDLFAAQQFSRQVMGCEEMTSVVAAAFGADLPAFLDLACGSDGLDAIDRARFILTVGFDSRYGYSPIGVRVKKAAERGATIVTVNDAETNLDLLSEAPLTMEPSGWAGLLRVLFAKGEKDLSGLPSEVGEGLDRAQAALLASPGCSVVIAGPGILRVPDKGEIVAALEEIGRLHGFRIITAHPFTNLSGMLAMGALAGVKPGEALRKNGPETHGQDGAPAVKLVNLSRRRSVVYIVGETCPDWLPPHDFLIYQNALPAPSSCRPGLILPSALFSESAGTMITLDGRLVSFAAAVEPQGQARPDWWIMGKIAQSLGRGRMAWGDVAAVQVEIRKCMKSFQDAKRKIAFTGLALDPSYVGRGGHGKASPSLRAPDLDAYRGTPLREVAAGMKQLAESVRTAPVSDDVPGPDGPAGEKA